MAEGANAAAPNADKAPEPVHTVGRCLLCEDISVISDAKPMFEWSGVRLFLCKACDQRFRPLADSGLPLSLAALLTAPLRLDHALVYDFKPAERERIDMAEILLAYYRAELCERGVDEGEQLEREPGS